MLTNKIGNVSFGYRLTPRFVEDTRWNHGNIARGSLLYKLQNMGNDNILIDTKSGGLYNDKDYDIMKFPSKYHYKKRIYSGGARKIENVKNAEQEAIGEIITKFSKKGKLKFVKDALIEDFPYLEKSINEVVKNIEIKSKELNINNKRKGLSGILRRFI